MKLAMVSLLAVYALAQPQQSAVFAQQFVQLLAAGNFSAAEQNFDATMRSRLPEEKLRAAWASLIDQVGPFKRQTRVKAEKVQGSDVLNVTCEFEKATLTVRVVLNGVKQISGLWFLPTESTASDYKAPPYVNPSSFHEREVLFGIENWMVHGTLSIPSGVGPFPAVVLVHGSGPHDRDETIGPNKPFRDLAWGLASHKIAVLRYEKRTQEHAAKVKVSDFTVKEETVDDAIEAARVLHSTERINGSKVFVLGHSLGGTVAPWIGKSDPALAGLVILAGSTRPMEDVLVDQFTYLASLGQVTNKDLEKVQAQAARVKDPRLSKATPKEELPLGIPAAYWLAFKAYNPPQVARQLTQPILILQGERDYQVTMQDFEGWKSALSNRKDVRFKTYPDLNHLFMEGQGKATPAEYKKAGHVQQAVIEDIANWINERR